MLKKFRVVPSSRCSCREAKQTNEHVIQDCLNLQQMRETTWITQTTLQKKLYEVIYIEQYRS